MFCIVFHAFYFTAVFVKVKLYLYFLPPYHGNGNFTKLCDSRLDSHLYVHVKSQLYFFLLIIKALFNDAFTPDAGLWPSC